MATADGDGLDEGRWGKCVGGGGEAMAVATDDDGESGGVGLDEVGRGVSQPDF